MGVSRFYLCLLIILGVSGCTSETVQKNSGLVAGPVNQLSSSTMTYDEQHLADLIAQERLLSEKLRIKLMVAPEREQPELRSLIAERERAIRRLEVEKMRLAQVRQGIERSRFKEQYDDQQHKLAQLRQEQLEEKQRQQEVTKDS